MGESASATRVVKTAPAKSIVDMSAEYLDISFSLSEPVEICSLKLPQNAHAFYRIIERKLNLHEPEKLINF